MAIAISILSVLPAQASPEQSLPSINPGQTSVKVAQQTDFGEPDGFVNPDQPIQIVITNAGSQPIDFQLTQPASVQRLLPVGGQISFGTTHTSYLPPPVYLLATPNQDDTAIYLNVISAQNNVLQLQVTERTSEIPGNHTVTIGTNGAVYIF